MASTLNFAEAHAQLDEWGRAIAAMKPRTHERVVIEAKMHELRHKLIFAQCPPRRGPIPPAYVLPSPINEAQT